MHPVLNSVILGAQYISGITAVSSALCGIGLVSTNARGISCNNYLSKCLALDAPFTKGLTLDQMNTINQSINLVNRVHQLQKDQERPSFIIITLIAIISFFLFSAIRMTCLFFEDKPITFVNVFVPSLDWSDYCLSIP